MAQYVKIAGMEFGLGLLVPTTRPLRCRPLSDSLTLSFDAIRRILSNKERTPRRELFAGRDWIGNQGRYGSCNGYAGAKALEKSRVLRGLKHVKLSGEGLYAQINGGRDGGSMLDDGMEALEKNGCPTEATVKVREFYTPRTLPEAARHEMPRFKAADCFRIDTEIQLASAIAQDFMCVAAVHVGEAYQNLDRDGVRGASHGDGNHAIHCVDVRIVDGEFQFDEAGSWDLDNGDQGYAWLTWRKHFISTVRNHAFYAIRSTIDDPQDADNPTIL